MEPTQTVEPTPKTSPFSGDARRRVEALKDLFGEKITDAQIAARANVNISTVIRYRRDYNIQPSRPRVSHVGKPPHREIYALFASLSLDEIAVQTGYTKVTLNNIFREYTRAKSLFDSGPQSDQHPLMLHKTEVGKRPDSEVAERFGISRQTVREFRNYFGIPPFVKR